MAARRRVQNFRTRILNRLQLIEHYLVDIAPAPFLARLEGSNDRMTGRLEMSGRMLAR